MPVPAVKLSAVIITFNEEHNIARCLESLKEVADEIIVVDSFSTDNTEQICNKYSVRFVTRKWMGYSAQKNYANSLAQHEYILSIDADEELSNELIQSILEIKRKPHAHVYYFSRLTNYCGQWIRYCGWYPDKKCRIWENGVAEWQGDVHEILVLEPKCSIAQLSGDLCHYTSYSIDQYLERVNRYTDLMAKDALKKGKTSSVLDVVFNPVIKFFKSYFLQLGFMDGYYGFIVCYTSAYATFYKYLKIRELSKTS